jgi:hypothetical protein
LRVTSLKENYYEIRNTRQEAWTTEPPLSPSLADFTPAQAVSVHDGGFVLRHARTWHYDGVPGDRKEPVIIAVFGIGPVDIQLADPKQPSYRRV